MQLETFEIEVNHATGVTTLNQMPGNCTAFKIPRNKMNAFLKSTKELDKCGVYLLLADSLKREVYVGESEPVAKRMKQHLQRPLFAWEEAIVFVGSGNLKWSKGDIRYMEHGLYEELKRCSQYKLVNGNTPQQTTVAHPSVWDSIIDGIKTLVSFLGHPKLFLKEKTTQDATKNNTEKCEPKGASHKRMTGASGGDSDYVKCPYSVASLMGAVVIKLADDGKLTQSDVTYLLSPNVRHDLKMKEGPYLKISLGVPGEHKNAKGRPRFMPNQKIKVGTSCYLLSRQFNPKGFAPVVSWIGKHGYNLRQAVALCKKMGMKEK